MFGLIAREAGRWLGAPKPCPYIRMIAHIMEDAIMQAIDVHEHARKLRDARGDLALPEAAQKARGFEERGDTKQAETWRRIEAALRQMQGPHVS